MSKMSAVKKIICTHCKSEAKLVTGKEVYWRRPDLWDKRFWRCEPCNAYVGCHPGTEKPLGNLALPEDRLWRIKAHSAFDRLWKSRRYTRKEAYAWLAGRMKMNVKNCHIGHMRADQCKGVVRVCSEIVTPGFTKEGLLATRKRFQDFNFEKEIEFARSFEERI
jgi:hypothetical protein